MITVASPKNFPEPLEKDDEGSWTKEKDETVKTAQAPFEFEEGDQAT